MTCFTTNREKYMKKWNRTVFVFCFVFPDRQPFIAGIYLLMSVDTVILPGKRGECCWFSFPLRVNCPFHSPGNRRTYLSKLNKNSDSFFAKIDTFKTLVILVGTSFSPGQELRVNKPSEKETGVNTLKE